MLFYYSYNDLLYDDKDSLPNCGKMKSWPAIQQEKGIALSNAFGRSRLLKGTTINMCTNGLPLGIYLGVDKIWI
jgi:hypothetical protein